MKIDRKYLEKPLEQRIILTHIGRVGSQPQSFRLESSWLMLFKHTVGLLFLTTGRNQRNG